MNYFLFGKSNMGMLWDRVYPKVWSRLAAVLMWDRGMSPQAAGSSHSVISIPTELRGRLQWWQFSWAAWFNSVLIWHRSSGNVSSPASLRNIFSPWRVMGRHSSLTAASWWVSEVSHRDVPYTASEFGDVISWITGILWHLKGNRFWHNSTDRVAMRDTIIHRIQEV